MVVRFKELQLAVIFVEELLDVCCDLIVHDIQLDLESLFGELHVRMIPYVVNDHSNHRLNLMAAKHDGKLQPIDHNSKQV